MQQLNLKPTHKLVKSYYEALGQFGQLDIDHEGAVRGAFQNLLAGCGRQFDWTLVAEWAIQRPKAGLIKVDGALIDAFHLARGFWEAKDEHDDLDKEIRAKLEKGYPKNNIIFQAPERAVLIQNGIRRGLPEDIRDSANLVELLKEFFGYREPHYEEWDAAVAEFEKRIPQVADGIKAKIEEQRRVNRAFVERFDAFYELCRQAINPNLSLGAVEEMLIQHLMTERIFRKIFDNPDFTRRNVIAVEIDKIIDAMTEKELSRDTFLKSLDHFYRAIELAAENTETYQQKQDFINTVYERFFHGYSPNEADTHGIVYTPQPIVDFMVRSVEDILKKEFGRSLSDKDVHILDPFVGTGNFITRVMKEIKTSALPYKYENELHCNEVMLLPYYVASMNIEHEYLERTGEYKAFPGICLVDTFELAEPEQSKLSFMTEENTARVKRQKEAPIFVIIANPPYNVGQVNENDNNKNRKYKVMDRRVSDTYVESSEASNKNALNDPYVKAFRWASDRIGTNGIVAFVSNNSFFSGIAFDGLRKHLCNDFSAIIHVNLKGDARTSGIRRKQEGGNVFNDAIKVGVGITFFVRKAVQSKASPAICVFEVEDFTSSELKRGLLDKYESVFGLPLHPVIISDDCKHWSIQEETESIGLPIGSRTTKKGSEEDVPAIFKNYGRGIASCRDVWAYNAQRDVLANNVESMVSTYNLELSRWIAAGKPSKVDDLLTTDMRRVSWSEGLKHTLLRGVRLRCEPARIRTVLYRPFDRRFVYFDRHLLERRYQMPVILPTESSEFENQMMVVNDIAYRSPYSCLMSSKLVDLHLCSSDAFQCFPFFTYDEDGSNRRENITYWALSEFRAHYSDPDITKWNIFHYVYAVLHHPEYRERYAANLKRELPRIPFVCAAESPNGDTIVAQGVSPGSAGINEPRVPSGTTQTADPSARVEALGRDDNNKESAGRGAEAPLYPNDGAPDDKQVFWEFAKAGERLADLHVNYEQQPEYTLARVEKGQLNWRVEKMRLGKDKTTLFYNEFLTLRGIPPETYEYRLGNRSALEWVIDQYQVSTDKRSGITNDPNRADDPEYIVRLIGQVITVSLEAMKIVRSLPPLVSDQG